MNHALFWKIYFESKYILPAYSSIRVQISPLEKIYFTIHGNGDITVQMFSLSCLALNATCSTSFFPVPTMSQ